MTALLLRGLDQADHLVSPEEFSDVRLSSSAFSIFTDFRHHEPIAFVGSMRAIDAARIMGQTHARLRLVVDCHGEFIGVVTEEDLCERNLLRYVAAGERRDDILVMDVMRHRHEIKALEYEDLVHASVKDVLDTLQGSGHQHCLVVDSRAHNIRGLVAASDIARRLHMNLEIHAGPTFAEIFSAVHHPALN